MKSYTELPPALAAAFERGMDKPIWSCDHGDWDRIWVVSERRAVLACVKADCLREGMRLRDEYAECVVCGATPANHVVTHLVPNFDTECMAIFTLCASHI